MDGIPVFVKDWGQLGAVIVFFWILLVKIAPIIHKDMKAIVEGLAKQHGESISEIQLRAHAHRDADRESFLEAIKQQREDFLSVLDKYWKIIQNLEERVGRHNSLLEQNLIKEQVISPAHIAIISPTDKV